MAARMSRRLVFVGFVLAALSLVLGLITAVPALIMGSWWPRAAAVVPARRSSC